MIGVGREVASALLGDHSRLLYPFRFERFATGDLHPVSSSPYPCRSAPGFTTPRARGTSTEAQNPTMTSRTSNGVRTSMILRQSILSRSVPTAREHRSAAIVLGEQHPLPKALARHRTVTHQTSLPSRRLRRPGSLYSPTSPSGPCSRRVRSRRARVRGRLGQHRRSLVDRVHELIVGGAASLRLPVVVRERQRLVSRKERERLARSLERPSTRSGARRGPQGVPSLQGLSCLRTRHPRRAPSSTSSGANGCRFEAWR